jgi:hypothetical protein
MKKEEEQKAKFRFSFLDRRMYPNLFYLVTCARACVHLVVRVCRLPKSHYTIKTE